ncbi:MAG: hypothetical protein RIC35_08790 [Marinoscillum sp.]
MAILLIAATVGITMHKHYCMGRLQEVSYFENGKHCMEMAGLDNENQECPMKCCKDTKEEYKVDEMNASSFEFDLHTDFHLISVLSYFIIELDLLKGSTDNFAYSKYKPPLIERDIPVMIQSFLL